MKTGNNVKKVCIVFIALLLSAFSPTSAQNDHLKILVISLDGARPDAILEADTPNMQALAEHGAVTWNATTIFPPATIPGHASMLTGLDVSEHGIDYNAYSTEIMQAPTFLTLASEAGYKSAMVVGKEAFSQFHQSEDVFYELAYQGDRSVVDVALTLIEADYEVIFLQFPNPDYFGHSTGWMSDTYLYELSNTDYQIGRLLDVISDETSVIITADHGGHDEVHGSNVPEDMNIPFIIAGPGIEPGTLLNEPVSVADTAMTVLWTLDLPLPETELGNPVYEAFTER